MSVCASVSGTKRARILLENVSGWSKWSDDSYNILYSRAGKRNRRATQIQFRHVSASQITSFILV